MDGTTIRILGLTETPTGIISSLLEQREVVMKESLKMSLHRVTFEDFQRVAGLPVSKQRLDFCLFVINSLMRGGPVDRERRKSLVQTRRALRQGVHVINIGRASERRAEIEEVQKLRATVRKVAS